MSAAAGSRENDDREDEGDEDVVPGPGPSKKKRVVSYNKKWEEKHSWVKPVSGDQSRVFCTFCRREFSITHGGENDLKQHASTDMHKRATKNKGASNIATFFANSSAEQDRIAACEVTSVYHTVQHGLSYNSMDCSNKLSSTMFCDSIAAKKMQCGRTKAEMITTNVLAPKTVSDILKELNPPVPRRR